MNQWVSHFKRNEVLPVQETIQVPPGLSPELLTHLVESFSTPEVVGLVLADLSPELLTAKAIKFLFEKEALDVFLREEPHEGDVPVFISSKEQRQANATFLTREFVKQANELKALCKGRKELWQAESYRAIQNEHARIQTSQTSLSPLPPRTFTATLVATEFGEMSMQNGFVDPLFRYQTRRLRAPGRLL